ncbi:transglycosylase SLT domain-containing protein [Terasakiella pusilla]|uniref:transglycosylase SLT domain-containing protein n=1 Tax=Terasakiella pusilla TaxID=64973 RepID=UPI00146F995D|nr:transglycosylase SLT domain-containing protein [Terasakiella pusilla]
MSTGFSNFADGVGDLFNIVSTVSPSSNMKADDVLNTKSALNAVGSYKVPEFGITDVPDTGMIDGLKTFQANNALKVDGVMNPGGPTENALGQTLAKQGISTSDLLAKAKVPNVTPKLDVPKPVSTPPQTSWSASVPFGEAPKSKKPKLPKIDPMTGLSDPLANAPKGKMPTKKQWEEVAMMQQQKTSSAIIPQGDTVDQRIRSMMTDKRYGDKTDTRLRDHVQKQFQNAYPGKVEYDETGKMVQPTAVIRPQDVQPFDPDGELQNVSTETFKSEPIMMENVTSETRPVMAANMVELDGDKKTPQDHSYGNSNADPKVQPVPGGLERTVEAPTISKGKERIENVIKNRTGKFVIEKDPEATSEHKPWEFPSLGRDAVKEHDSLIQKMAQKHEMDPDLIRAVMWAESARGHKFGLNALGDMVGYSDSKMPMNINPDLWKEILGRENADLNNPEDNIEAAALILKRLGDRIDGEKDVAKIGTLWNGTGKDKTTDFGEYIGRLYREKPWLKQNVEDSNNAIDGP